MGTARHFPGLFNPSLATDPLDGEVVLFGGCPGVTCSGKSASNATWTYSSGTWTQLNLTTYPPARTGGQMGWDPVDGQVVLFGGDGCLNPPTCTMSGALNDTWSFAANRWTQQFPVASPPAAYEGAMAFDPSFPGMVLFGQLNFCLGHCGTWVFSAANWTWINVTGGPITRYDDSMAEAPAQNGALLFGGVANGNYQDDSWLFSNGSWHRQASTFLVPVRSEAAMTYDSSLGEPVLFGGVYVTLSNFPGVTYDDTWMFGASGWTQLTNSPTTPGARSASAMAFDPSSGVVVLVGGCGGGGCPYSDSWALGGANNVGLQAQPAACATVVFNSMPLDSGGARTLLNATYPLSARGCASATQVSVAAEGALVLTVISNNSTVGWNGTVRVLGSGTIVVNLTAASNNGSSGNGASPSAGRTLSSYYPLFAAGAVAGAAAAAILLFTRYRRGRSTAPRPPPLDPPSPPST
ncbi:MAG: hypothetical protein L3K04_03335 [Thermoplasmata archaeon]|nr:hypothetical protein [Thermoplasmata archaeon]